MCAAFYYEKNQPNFMIGAASDQPTSLTSLPFSFDRRHYKKDSRFVNDLYTLTYDDHESLDTVRLFSSFANQASGLAIFCAGIWMQVELHKYLELNSEYSHIAPYILVGTGAFILLVSSLACCCTVKGHPTLLYMYGGFLAFILVVQLGVAISMYAYKDRMADGFDKGLENSMLSYGPDDPTRNIDFFWMQKKLQCCGNHGYKDWLCLPRPMPVPKSCCIRPKCDVQDETQIYLEGCYEKVTELIGGNMSWIVAAAVLVALFPIVGIILTCSMAANIMKTKYEQMA